MFLLHFLYIRSMHATTNRPMTVSAVAKLFPQVNSYRQIKREHSNSAKLYYFNCYIASH